MIRLSFYRSVGFETDQEYVQRFGLKQGCFDKPGIQSANYYFMMRAHTEVINKVIWEIRMVTAAHDFTWQ